MVAIALAFGGSRCASPECTYPPCPVPTAISIVVTSASGDPILGASADVTGAVKTVTSCRNGSQANICLVPGTAGTYDLRVSAAGYQTATQNVVVSGTNPPCGCPTVNSQTITVVLTPMEVDSVNAQKVVAGSQPQR